EVARLTRELNEARDQQTATLDVLQVISSFAGELDPVFRTILINATRICEANRWGSRQPQQAAQLCRAERASITLPKGETYHRVASFAFRRSSEISLTAIRSPQIEET